MRRFSRSPVPAIVLISTYLIAGARALVTWPRLRSPVPAASAEAACQSAQLPT